MACEVSENGSWISCKAEALQPEAPSPGFCELSSCTPAPLAGYKSIQCPDKAVQQHSQSPVAKGLQPHMAHKDGGEIMACAM